MSSAPFRFKQFQVRQNQAAMKVGVDGVLLGAWAQITEGHRVLDVGTGTGLIALMAAQRSPEAEIRAIEIQAEAAQEAQQNFGSSPFSNRLDVLHIALQDFRPENVFDHILCNPPFFKATSLAPDEGRSIARQGVSLSINELMEHTARLASEAGQLHMVFPFDRREEVLEAALVFDWHLIRRMDVRPRLDKPKHRVLLSFGRKAQNILLEELYIETSERHHYSSDYIGLTKDFYLKM
jgi:tRNA1Val (adenine37-N6)-methyltransferase